jgi:hypothetical protein
MIIKKATLNGINPLIYVSKNLNSEYTELINKIKQKAVKICENEKEYFEEMFSNVI